MYKPQKTDFDEVLDSSTQLNNEEKKLIPGLIKQFEDLFDYFLAH